MAFVFLCYEFIFIITTSKKVTANDQIDVCLKMVSYIVFISICNIMQNKFIRSFNFNYEPVWESMETQFLVLGTHAIFAFIFVEIIKILEDSIPYYL